MTRSPNDLLHGTLDVLVLKTLSWGPMHGYGITRWIETQTRGVLTIEDAALYKALHRLQRDGAITSEWGVSENNRKARYYRLTARGRQRLRAELETWRAYAGAVGQVLDPA
ncbi:MAG TPA: PadR family transcriptional regulator [Gemmatimonadaceae bacterium]